MAIDSITTTEPALDAPDTTFAASKIVRLHLSIAAVLTAIVAIAPQLINHPNAPKRLHVFADPILGGWLRWDGWWYVMIARHGYTYAPHHISSVAFFPVYPMLVRAVGFVLPGGAPLGAILLTLTSGATAFVLFHAWCQRRLSGGAARAAVIALAVYPFAWFVYATAYSDAFYLVLVLSAFLLLEDDRPVLAGLVGALATAARPTGVTLLIGLVAVMAERRGLLRRRPVRAIRARDLGVLLSIGGLVTWCVWLAVRFGNPLAFVETEGAPGWDQAPGVHTWLKLGFFHKLEVLPTPEAIAIVLQVFVCVAFVCLLPTVARRFGPGYTVYAAAALLMPVVGSGDFLGMGRYLLPVFPVFAVIGASAHDAPWRRNASIASGALLAIGTALFSAGFLIS